MSRINRKVLQEKSDFLQLGDVCYFSSLDYWNEDALDSLDFEWQPWMEKIVPGSHIGGVLQEAANLLLLGRLSDLYEIYRERFPDAEPEWFKNLPNKNQQYMRHKYFITCERLDPLAILPTLPFSGFGYILLEDGLTERIIKLFRLTRLKGIKQLGYLHYPIISSAGAEMLTRGFDHDRYVHSMDVSIIGRLILGANGRSKSEQDLYSTAGLTHDTLTPAGGDSIKWIDQKMFDEDLHYPTLMERIDFEQLPELPANAPEILPQIILNRGLLGSVLDIADKIAYIARDLQAFHINGPKLAGYNELKTLLKEEPQPCSIWECVRIENEQMYFSDKARLVNFLKIRATMFGKLYQNPASRFWEMFVKTFVQKELYETGKLTKDDLLRMQDIHLQEVINQNIEPHFMGSLIGMNAERMETFATEQEAKARMQQLYSAGRRVMVIEKAFVAKAGVHFLVKTENGLQPLSVVDPESAESIRNAMHPNYQFGLHYLDTHYRKLPKILQSWKT